MMIPVLAVTPAAKSELLRHMASITEFETVVSILWIIASSSGHLDAAGSENFEFLGPHWSVGFCNASRFPESEISIIDGVPFVLDDGGYSSRLVGTVLDYTDGVYLISEAVA